MFKRLVAFFVVAMVLALPLRVSAINNVCFSLQDVTTEKNKLFETTLSANSQVVAFVVTLNFDESLAFKEAKAIDKDAELSVNDESGKVTIAYLCESGTEGELIKLTFKSSGSDSHIDLKAEQVLDKDEKEINVLSKGSDVTVLSKVTPRENKTSDKTQTTTAEIFITPNTTHIEIPPKSTLDFTLILCLLCIGALIVVAMVLAFLLGKQSEKTKEEDDNNETNS